MIRIGLIGDFDPEVKAHIAIPKAIQLAADQLEVHVSCDWIATPTLESDVANQFQLLVQSIRGLPAKFKAVVVLYYVSICEHARRPKWNSICSGT